ncbi:hypothetical protein ACFLZQ_05225 [Thermodesulfobacteriota bacterium]
MTPRHSYYNIAELLGRWADNKFTEMDLLKWGAEGKLQFSILLSDTREPRDMTEDSHEITIRQVRLEDPKYVLCDECTLRTKRELFKLAPEIIDKIIVSPDKNHRVIKILPWCNDCDTYSIPDKNAFQVIISSGTIAEAHAEASGDFRQLWNYGKDDLVIELDEVKRFEKEFPVFEEYIPPYLYPKHPYYSVELAIAVDTWKALFVDGINLDKRSGKQAGAEYIRIKYKDRKFKKPKRELIAAIAASKYVQTYNWEKFRKEWSSPND